MPARACEVCKSHLARFICIRCGRHVCEACLEPTSWSCAYCYRGVKREETFVAQEALSVGLTPLKFFILGFVTIFIGMALLTIASLMRGSAVGVWIFPLPPIIIGSGQEGLLITLIMTLLAIFILLIMLLIHRRA